MLSGAVFKIRNKRRQNRIDAWLQGFTCFILSKRVVSFKEYSGVMGEAGNVTEATKKELTAEVKRLIFAKEKINFYEIDLRDSETMELHMESSIREVHGAQAKI
ncbi:hypothetical protein LEP1GSC043_0129 [Leptospira weilii str. Ecochallenge]|uniref:Uncharacterized protein n=1 Tax=Leptospira weilii str. Ecochallenge TaxID=1049986 RepID=N1U3A2_9LEPT|nr:hypothetical protein LEP1GSC043_0129 [Leptospira weilii str. Ecochallenge]